MGKKKFWILLLMVSVVIVASACSSNNSEENPSTSNESQNESGEQTSVNTPNNEPVTLKVYGYSWYKSAFDFFKPFVEEEYPHITLEWIDGKNEEEIITSGQLPDIQISGFSYIGDIASKDIPYDMNDLVKKYQTDLSVFDPKVLHVVEMFGKNGELYALPFKTNYYMMVYNKDIFDTFAKPYPTESMTWDEVLELAKSVHRENEGVQIRGIVVRPQPTFVARGLSLAPIDHETDEVHVNNDGFVQVFNLLRDIYSIPGNGNLANTWNAKQFLEGTVAMYASFGGFNGFEDASFNWDVTTYPHFASSPEGNMEVAADVLYLWKTSEHKDEAFKVISYISTNEEIQTAWAKEGTAPAIMLDNLGEIFGQNSEVLKDKNTAAIFASPYRENHVPSQYETEINSIIMNNFKKYLSGEIDVRTALSLTEEETAMKIAELKQAEE